MYSKIDLTVPIILATVASSLVATSAIAQTHTTSTSTYFTDNFETTDNALERAFMDQGRYFWDNTTIWHQIKFNFGLFYPDNAITQDTKVGHVVYTDMLEQQVGLDPILRTPDLPNPFNSSLRTNPSYLGIGGIEPVTGSEFVIERQPLR